MRYTGIVPGRFVLLPNRYVKGFLSACFPSWQIGMGSSGHARLR